MDIQKKKENPIQWLVRYFKESREELRKVTWPSKEDTIKYSVIIIALTVILGVFFGGLDWLFSNGIELLISTTN